MPGLSITHHFRNLSFSRSFTYMNSPSNKISLSRSEISDDDIPHLDLRFPECAGKSGTHYRRVMNLIIPIKKITVFWNGPMSNIRDLVVKVENADAKYLVMADDGTFVEVTHPEHPGAPASYVVRAYLKDDTFIEKGTFVLGECSRVTEVPQMLEDIEALGGKVVLVGSGGQDNVDALNACIEIGLDPTYKFDYWRGIGKAMRARSNDGNAIADEIRAISRVDHLEQDIMPAPISTKESVDNEESDLVKQLVSSGTMPDITVVDAATEAKKSSLSTSSTGSSETPETSSENTSPEKENNANQKDIPRSGPHIQSNNNPFINEKIVNQKVTPTVRSEDTAVNKEDAVNQNAAPSHDVQVKSEKTSQNKENNVNQKTIPPPAPDVPAEGTSLDKENAINQKNVATATPKPSYEINSSKQEDTVRQKAILPKKKIQIVPALPNIDWTIKPSARSRTHFPITSVKPYTNPPGLKSVMKPPSPTGAFRDFKIFVDIPPEDPEPAKESSDSDSQKKGVTWTKDATTVTEKFPTGKNARRTKAQEVVYGKEEIREREIPTVNQVKLIGQKEYEAERAAAMLKNNGGLMRMQIQQIEEGRTFRQSKAATVIEEKPVTPSSKVEYAASFPDLAAAAKVVAKSPQQPVEKEEEAIASAAPPQDSGNCGVKKVVFYAESMKQGSMASTIPSSNSEVASINLVEKAKQSSPSSSTAPQLTIQKPVSYVASMKGGSMVSETPSPKSENGGVKLDGKSKGSATPSPTAPQAAVKKAVSYANSMKQPKLNPVKHTFGKPTSPSPATVPATSSPQSTSTSPKSGNNSTLSPPIWIAPPAVHITPSRISSASFAAIAKKVVPVQAAVKPVAINNGKMTFSTKKPGKKFGSQPVTPPSGQLVEDSYNAENSENKENQNSVAPSTP